MTLVSTVSISSYQCAILPTIFALRNTIEKERKLFLLNVDTTILNNIKQQNSIDLRMPKCNDSYGPKIKVLLDVFIFDVTLRYDTATVPLAAAIHRR